MSGVGVRRGPPRSLASFAVALGLAAPAIARAEGPQQLAIATAGTCPSAEEVTEELRQLLPDATLDVSPDVVDSDVIVSDRGAGYTVKKKYPNGALKEEAEAIAFESAAARNDPSASRLAQKYLAAFPHGRFRAQAEQVLANQ